MMRTVPLDLVGESYPSRSKQISSQTCVNLYPEINDGVRTPAALYCWPGLTSFATSAEDDRGLYVFNNELYQVAGQSLLKIASDGTVTTIGTVQGFERCVFADDGQNLVIASPARLHIYNGTTIQVGPAVSGTTSVAMVNNRAIYDRGGGVWASANVFDPLTIDPQNVAVAEAAGDDLLRVFSFNQTLYLCGQKTIESWYNSGVGNPPFERVEGGIINKGVAGRYAICNDDEVAYFLGDDRTVYALAGYQIRSLMTPAISHEFESYSDVSDVVMWTTHIEGQDFVILDFPTANKTWGFSRTTNAWFQLSSGDTGDKWTVTSYAYCYGKHVVARGGPGNSSIALMSVDSYADVTTTSVSTGSTSTSTQFALTSAADIAGDDLVIFNWSDYSVVQAENIDSADTAAYSLKFSPDGSYLAIYTHDGDVRILETTGWTVVKTFTSPTDYGTLQSYVCFAWSPDSRYLAMSGDDTDALLVWDSQNSWANVYTGTYTAQYVVGCTFYQLDWSPDGSYLACANSDYDAPIVFDTSDWSDFYIDMTGTPFTAGLGDYATGVQFKSDGASMYLSWSNSGYVHLAIIDTSTWTVSQDFSSVTLSGTFDPPDNAGIYLSPDEEKIVFQSSSTFSGTDAYHLITMASGSPVSINAGAIYSDAPPIFSFPGAAWKLDSSEFACVVSASGDLYSVDASTGVPSVELASGVYLYAIDSQVVSTPNPPVPVITTSAQIKERITAPFNSSKVGLPLGKRLMMNRLELIMETGVGIATGQGSDPEVMISCSADGGQTYGPEHFIKVGKGGEYMKKVEWYNIQSGYEFVFKIRFSDPTFFCLHGASIDVDTAGY